MALGTKTCIGKIFWVLVIFCLIYAIKFSFSQLSSIYVAFLLLLPLMTKKILSENGFFFRFRCFEIGSFFPFLLSIAYVFLSSATNQSPDLILAQSSVVVTILIVSSFFVARLMVMEGFNFRELISLITCAIVMQGSCILLYYFWPNFRELVDSLVPIGGNFDESPLFRSRGLTNSPSALLSVTQAVGFYFSVYLFFISSSIAEWILWFLAGVVLFLSIFLSGRTGFLICPALLVFLTSWFVLVRKQRSHLLKRLAGGLSGIIVLVLIFCCLIGFWDTNNASILGETVSWALDPFNAYSSARGTDVWEMSFRKHWVSPWESSNFWFGNINNYEAINSKTDLGYIRNFFALGFIGSMIYYLGYLIPLFIAFRVPEVHEKLALLILFLWLLTTEIKEPFLRSSSLNILFFLPMFFLLIHKSMGRNQIAKY
ncbi:MAG: hypothetical protein C0412_01620 [Flavobacterium sp.]|nr:hypothetical protein [Flavobacterium sp.]